MNIAIRADASIAIGTGHVMREIAIAQYLLSASHQVTLFASIAGPQWLREYVQSQKGLVWEEVREGDFSAGLFLTGDAFDALVVDAYTLNQDALELLEETIPVVAVIIDGPSQKLSGKLAIAPTLDPNPDWAAEYQERFEEFHWGPGYFALGNAVLSARGSSRCLVDTQRFRIVVALGGSDVLGLTQIVVESLQSLTFPCRVDVFSPSPRPLPRRSPPSHNQFHLHGAGPRLVEHMASASLAITGAGTMVAELAYLGVVGIFLPLAENQAENVRAIEQFGLGFVVSPDTPLIHQAIVDTVRAVWQNPQLSGQIESAGSALVDGKGSERVFKLLAKVTL